MSGPSTYVLANMVKGFRLDASSSSQQQRQLHETTMSSNSTSSGTDAANISSISSSAPSSSSTLGARVYQDLVNELIDRSRHKRIKDWKGHLSLLRELTVFLAPRDILSIDICEALNSTLLQLQGNQLNSDVGKKIFRLTCHIIFDSIVKIANISGTSTTQAGDSDAQDNGHNNGGSGPSNNKSAADFSITSSEVQGLVIELFKTAFNAVEKVDDNSTTSAKMFFCWRLLGSFVGHQTVPSELSDKLIEQVTSHLKSLTFPEKKKATLLSGLGNSNARYERKLHHWTSLFSCLNRAKRLVPIDMIELVYKACASSHAPLARHALSLLNSLAIVHPSVVAQGMLHKLKEEAQLLNFTDNTCIAYIFKICYSLLEDNPSRSKSGDPGTSDDVLCQLYEAVLKLAKNSRSTKISLDALKLVLSVQRAWYFVKDLLMKGTANVTQDCVQVIVRHLTAPVMYLRDGSLRENLSSSSPPVPASPSTEGADVQSIAGGSGGKLSPGNIFFPLIMRNCVRLGRFLICRPEGLSLTMSTSRRRRSSKKSNMEGQEEGGMDRSSFESTKRPSFTSETSKASKSMLDIEQENLSLIDDMLRPVGQILIGIIRQIKALTSPFPHALADVMKALIWTAPDPTYDADTDKIDHLDLWQWLSQQLSSSLGMFGADLCMDIIRNIAGRLKESSPNSVMTIAKLAVSYTEKCVCRYPSEDVCMLLPQCWNTLLETHERCMSLTQSSSLLNSWTLRKLVLTSVLMATDESSWCKNHEKSDNSFGPLGWKSPMPPALADALRLRAHRNLSLMAYYTLGEHAIVLGDISGCIPGGSSPTSQNTSSCTHLVHIVVRLVITIYTENSTKCASALSALTKISIRMTNEEPSENILRLVAFISSQLRSMCVELSGLSYVTRSKEGSRHSVCTWKRAMECVQSAGSHGGMNDGIKSCNENEGAISHPIAASMGFKNVLDAHMAHQRLHIPNSSTHQLIKAVTPVLRILNSFLIQHDKQHKHPDVVTNYQLSQEVMVVLKGMMESKGTYASKDNFHYHQQGQLQQNQHNSQLGHYHHHYQESQQKSSENSYNGLQYGPSGDAHVKYQHPMFETPEHSEVTAVIEAATDRLSMSSIDERPSFDFTQPLPPLPPVPSAPPPPVPTMPAPNFDHLPLHHLPDNELIAPPVPSSAPSFSPSTSRSNSLGGNNSWNGSFGTTDVDALAPQFPNAFSGFDNDDNSESLAPSAPTNLSATSQRRRSKELQNKQMVYHQQPQHQFSQAQTSFPIPPPPSVSTTFSDVPQSSATDPFASMVTPTQPFNQQSQQQPKAFDPFAGFGNSNPGF